MTKAASLGGSKINPPWAVHNFKPPALPEVADDIEPKSFEWQSRSLPPISTRWNLAGLSLMTATVARGFLRVLSVIC
jgi:hypothetical protein